MGRPKKNEFEDLDQDYTNELANLTSEELKGKVAEIALELQALMEAKDNDEDLKQAVEVAKEAGAVYREGAKGAKVRIKFIKRLLESRGK